MLKHLNITWIPQISYGLPICEALGIRWTPSKKSLFDSLWFIPERSDLGVYVNHDGAVNSDSRIVVPTVQELLEGMQRVNLEENRQLECCYQNMEPTDADILICYSTVPGTLGLSHSSSWI